MEGPPAARDEEEYEQTHVHSVYNSIASHFSQTRYKPWPIVEQFLKDLAPGSVGLDIGCGNGKYLAVRDDVFIVGSDRSDELVKIAKKHEKHDALVGDALSPPHPPGRFDFVISIAVLHHLSARERRIEGVRVALDKLKERGQNPARKQGNGQAGGLQENNNGGQALFFVWALEQKGSRRGWDEGGEQDVLVPWVLKPTTESSRQGKTEKVKKKSRKKRVEVNLADEPENGHDEGCIEKEESSTDTRPGAPAVDSAGTQPPDDAYPDVGAQKPNDTNAEQIFHRYYHLYHQGELEEDIISAGGEIVKNGYDRDNWWCIARKSMP